MRNFLLFVALLSCLGCSGLFFYPNRTLYSTPQELGIPFEERVLDDGAGPRLMTWFLPAERSKGLVVYLHGNAENMSSHLAGVYWLPKSGYDLLLADYRGYGGSAGWPSLEGINTDVARIFRYAVKFAKDRDEPLFLFGQSMGASLGLYGAANSEFRGVFRAIVAESAFSSYRKIAREKIAANWLISTLGYPFTWTISDQFAPLNVVSQLSTGSILFVTGESDHVVDPEHTLELFKLAPEPKVLWRVPGVGHIQIFNDPVCRTQLVQYLDQFAKRS